MRKLIMKMSMSIDGYVCGPNGELDWMFKTMSTSGKKWISKIMENVDVHIMGSRTFNDMRKYWPYSDDLLASQMNNIPKIVFSKKGVLNDSSTTTAIKDAKAADADNGLKQSAQSDHLESWLHPKIATGDLMEEIMKLKQQPGKDIIAHGGAGFMNNLVKTGLIDEYYLAVHPAVIGKGLSIFSGLAQPEQLELVKSTQFESGVLGNIYIPNR